jgi:mRNA interferase HigB
MFYFYFVVVIAKRKLIEFNNAEPKAREALMKWYHEVALSDWQNLGEIRKIFNSVDSVGNDRFIFNIGGNKYRIVAMIHFTTRTVYIRFVGTHKQYGKIDCKTI